MRYKIENEYLTVEADTTGGELSSVLSKRSGREYLWQGDPAYWAGRAYNMFPFNGRLLGGKIKVGGVEYDMPVHGIVRRTELNGSCDGETMSFELESNAETQKVYPYKFIYRVTYSLRGASLDTCVTVVNRGEKPMYFGIGMHPGINVPFDAGKAFEEYSVAFASGAVKRRVMTADVLDSGRDEPFPCELALRHDLFDSDAIMLSGTGGAAVITAGANSVRVDYPDCAYIGLWHKAGLDCPYLCFEPMSILPGPCDRVCDIERFPGITKLDAGGEYRSHVKITIEEK